MNQPVQKFNEYLNPIFTLFFLGLQLSTAQLPKHVLVGYWQNWNVSSSPYIPIDQIDDRYHVIEVSFAIPKTGTDFDMEFVPDQGTENQFISQIQSQQNKGKKVLISIGGATAPITLNNETEKNTFISSMNTIITTFGFDGIDIDLEGTSVNVSGGTISNPTDQSILNMINAIEQIMSDFRETKNKKLLLTMAPETAFVQGGQSTYQGLWGAYLPIIHALRDSIDILQVQLYNSGSMYGIDRGIYNQATADFIVAMSEAVIQGFNTNGGQFDGIPADKIAIALPACGSAAGGGYTSPAEVKLGIDYLMGKGNKPGTYTLQQAGGYPNLKGMMTWSINWDAVGSCASSYEYADNFENIFGTPSTIKYSKGNGFINSTKISQDYVQITLSKTYSNLTLQLANLKGEIVSLNNFNNIHAIQKDITRLKSGMYVINVTSPSKSHSFKFYKKD